MPMRKEMDLVMTTPNPYRPHKLQPGVAQLIDNIIRTNAIHHKTSFVVKSTDEILQLLEEEFAAADERDRASLEVFGDLLDEHKELLHNTANVINDLYKRRLARLREVDGDERDLDAQLLAETIEDLTDGFPQQDQHGV